MVNSGGAGIDGGAGERISTSYAYSDFPNSGFFYSLVTNAPRIGRVEKGSR